MAVKIRVGADTAGARRGLDDVAVGIDRIGKEAKESELEVRGLVGAFAKGQLAASALTAAMAAAGQAARGLAGLGADAIQLAADYETAQARLATLLGSVEAAEQRMDELARFAASTPFQLDELIQAEIRLQGVGLASEETRRRVADLAVFMGRDVREAADQFARAMTSGAGSADLLREAGVLAMVEMQEGMKLTEMSTEQFQEAFLRLLESDKIRGGTQRLAEQFNGLVSTMRDTWDTFLRSVGQSGPLQFAKATLEELLATVGDNRDEVDALARTLGTELRKAMQGVILLAGGLADALDVLLVPVRILDEAWLSLEAQILAVEWGLRKVLDVLPGFGDQDATIRRIEWRLAAIGEKAKETGKKLLDAFELDKFAFADELVDRIGKRMRDAGDQAGEAAQQVKRLGNALQDLPGEGAGAAEKALAPPFDVAELRRRLEELQDRFDQLQAERAAREARIARLESAVTQALTGITDPRGALTRLPGIWGALAALLLDLGEKGRERILEDRQEVQDAILGALDDLPELLSAAIIEGTPEFAGALAEGVVSAAIDLLTEGFFNELVAVLTVDVPRAIAAGIIAALTEFFTGGRFTFDQEGGFTATGTTDDQGFLARVGAALSGTSSGPDAKSVTSDGPASRDAPVVQVVLGADLQALGFHVATETSRLQRSGLVPGPTTGTLRAPPFRAGGGS